MIEVSNLQPEEEFPSFMDAWMKGPATMRDWVWIAIANGETVGLLIAAPCHGLVYLARFQTAPNAPASTMLHLLRRCFADCRQRGYSGYFSQVNPTLATERKIIGLVRANGGMQMIDPMVMVAGKLMEKATVNL